MRLILGTPSFLGRGKLQTQTRRALSLQAVSQDSGTRRPHNCATFLCHCGAPLIPRWTPTHTHTHTPIGTDDSHWQSPRQAGGGLLHGDLTTAGPPGQMQQSWAITWGLAFQGLQRPVAVPAAWAPAQRPLARPPCGALTRWPSVPGPPEAGLPSLAEFPPGLPGSLSSLLK